MHLLTSSLIVAAVAATTSFSHKDSLTITSTAFTNNGNIPSKYSCEGEKINPPLNIAGVPDGTKSFAIIVHDPDAQREGGFTHWVVWNIEPLENPIPENYKGGEQGLNGANQPGYIGMCPPTGTHHYHFKVYALDTLLSLNKKTDKAGLEKSMEGHILAQGELIGLYKKMNQ